VIVSEALWYTEFRFHICVQYAYPLREFFSFVNIIKKTAAPPVAPVAPGSVHVRVAAVLTPARGKRQTASAWAIEAHDVGPGGAMTERLRARGAIATAATHHAHARETVAKRHTRQVAMQVATGPRVVASRRPPG